MKSKEDLRTEMIAVARSLFARGYSFGTAGNLSARCAEVLLVTPTGGSMETLAAGDLAEVGLDGRVMGPVKPSKEVHFHLAIYRARADVGAVVHLHSTYAAALSCMQELDMENALPALTPYYAMRVGRLPVVPYLPPGDPRLAPQVEQRAAAANAILLQNHGPVTMGRDLAEAAALAEELEQQAKLFLLLGERGRRLTDADLRTLRERFG